MDDEERILARPQASELPSILFRPKKRLRHRYPAPGTPQFEKRKETKKKYRKKVQEGDRAVKKGDYHNPLTMVVRTLKPEDRSICRNVVVYGLEWLRHSLGWTSSSIQAFINRPEIRREVETLRRLYQDRVGIQERTQFFAQLQVNLMVPSAVNVLARSLRGEKKDPVTGLVDEVPTKGQYSAAMEVLNRANIQGSKFGGVEMAPVIDARQIRVAIGASSNLLEGITPQGREKIRNVLARLISRVRLLDHNVTLQRERERDQMIARGQKQLHDILRDPDEMEPDLKEISVRTIRDEEVPHPVPPEEDTEMAYGKPAVSDDGDDDDETL